MSFQLVHLRSDPPACISGEGIPGALELVLQSLDASGEGTVYAYRPYEVAGKSYHVLSRSCDTREGCRLAHHLAMTEDEAAAMARHEAGPTPAGLMLALAKQQFWLDALPAAGELDRAPKLSATALPDASVQPTWKALTNHKDNARSFYTSPYAGDCLALLPPGTPVEDVLGLFHESDWLVPTLGWERGFTTAGTERSRYAETPRIAVPLGSPLEALAAAQGAAILRVDGALTLPPEDDQPDAPAPKREEAATPPIAKREAPRLPYSYSEVPDEDAYNVPVPSRHKVRNAIALAALALLGFGIYGAMFGGGDEVGGAAREAIRDYANDASTAELRALLERPYSPHVAQQRLAKLSRNLSQPAEGGEAGERAVRLHECVELLRSARFRDAGYAADLQRLMEAAELLQLPAERLATFYLCEATRDRDAASWRRAQRAVGEHAAWAALAERYPHARRWAQEPMLAAYLDGVIPAEPAPLP